MWTSTEPVRKRRLLLEGDGRAGLPPLSEVCVYYGIGVDTDPYQLNHTSNNATLG